MTLYNVHIYREMKLRFDGISAESPEAAANIARDKLTEDADDIEPCKGETLSALVDVVGNEMYEQSQMFDFESERIRKAAPHILVTLQRAEFLMRRVSEGDYKALENLAGAAKQCRATIFNVTKEGVMP